MSRGIARRLENGRTRYLGIVEEHRHGLRRICTITLEKRIHRNIYRSYSISIKSTKLKPRLRTVLTTVEHETVGGSGVLIGSSITVGEKSLHSRHVHVIESRELHTGVRVKKVLSRSRGRQESGGHLRVTSRSEAVRSEVTRSVFGVMSAIEASTYYQ